MENLEKQCEDALFVLCDARERFPQMSARELQKSIRLTKEINMNRVSTKPAESLGLLTIEKQNGIIDKCSLTDHASYEIMGSKLDAFTNKLNNLKSVMEQVHQEKNFEINKLLNE